MILHGPGIPGPAVARREELANSTLQSDGKDSPVITAANEANSSTAVQNKTVPIKSSVVTGPKKIGNTIKAKPTVRSTIASKYANYNGYNLHDDLAFEWVPGTAEVFRGDHGDYHNNEDGYHDDDSHVHEHSSDNHGDRGWHAGHGERGYGYEESRSHHGERMGHGHHGDHYGGEGTGYEHHGDHYGGEEHHSHHDDHH